MLYEFSIKTEKDKNENLDYIKIINFLKDEKCKTNDFERKILGFTCLDDKIKIKGKLDYFNSYLVIKIKEIDEIIDNITIVIPLYMVLGKTTDEKDEQNKILFFINKKETKNKTINSFKLLHNIAHFCHKNQILSKKISYEHKKQKQKAIDEIEIYIEEEINHLLKKFIYNSDIEDEKIIQNLTNQKYELFFDDVKKKSKFKKLESNIIELDSKSEYDSDSFYDLNLFFIVIDFKNIIFDSSIFFENSNSDITECIVTNNNNFINYNSFNDLNKNKINSIIDDDKNDDDDNDNLSNDVSNELNLKNKKEIILNDMNEKKSIFNCLDYCSNTEASFGELEKLIKKENNIDNENFDELNDSEKEEIYKKYTPRIINELFSIIPFFNDKYIIPKNFFFTFNISNINNKISLPDNFSLNMIFDFDKSEEEILRNSFNEKQFKILKNLFNKIIIKIDYDSIKNDFIKKQKNQDFSFDLNKHIYYEIENIEEYTNDLDINNIKLNIDYYSISHNFRFIPLSFNMDDLLIKDDENNDNNENNENNDNNDNNEKDDYILDNKYPEIKNTFINLDGLILTVYIERCILNKKNIEKLDNLIELLYD